MKMPPIVWVVAIGFLGLVAAILVPVFKSANTVAKRSRCMSSLKTLGTQSLMYAADYDDRLPDAHVWTDRIGIHVSDAQTFSCMARWGISFSYAMHDSLSVKDLGLIDRPERHLLLFESKVMTPNAHGDERLIVDPPRHGKVNYVVFADGHAKEQRSRLPSARPGGE